MKYTVSKKLYEAGVAGDVYTLQVDGSPWMQFPISREDFDRLNVKDSIWISISLTEPVEEKTASVLGTCDEFGGDTPHEPQLTCDNWKPMPAAAEMSLATVSINAAGKLEG